MADVLTRLVGPTLLIGAPLTVYTAPGPAGGNRTVTVRSIHVTNGSAASVNFTLSVGPDALGARFYDGQSIPSHGSFDWSGVLVLQSAEILQAFASAVMALQLTISGVVTA